MLSNRVVRELIGVVAGMGLGVVELLFLAVALPVRIVPSARPVVDQVAARLVAADRRRLVRWLGHRAERPAGYRFLAARALLGTLGAYLGAVGAFVAILFLGGALWALMSRRSDPVPIRLPGVTLTTDSWALGITIAVVLMALLTAWLRLIAFADTWIADHFLGPSRQEQMRRRIAELTVTRSGIVYAVDEERRRIERDLHDGVQQRVVALMMLLGRARHRPSTQERVEELVDQAYAETRHVLDELRSVAWRVYPTALDELGLSSALAGVAERSAIPVTVHNGLKERLASEIETVLYFVAREAITNAIKHAEAQDILVVLSEGERTVTITISDSGRGGADPSGGGLGGLARRVQALDGVFTVDSSAGGPTAITARLPKVVRCA